MAFPATPLGVTVELLLGGIWTDLTAAGYIYDREPVTVARGRADEATEVDRSTCRLQATNRSGNLSPRNPTGIYYGQLGRNTPLRVRLEPSSDAYLLLAGKDLSSGPFTVDTAGLSITGDIDLRAEVQRDRWDTQVVVASKYSGTTQRSWVLYINADNTLSLAWSADGSAMITKTSTAAVSVPASGRLAIRATLDVDNGAAGNDVKFWTATDLASSFSQLGSTVTTAGVTSIFDSTAGVGIGQNLTLSATLDALVGRIYGFEVYQGIAGTIRSEVDFDDVAPGSGNFLDTQGATWFHVDTGLTSVVEPAIRSSGEVSEWPQQWDSSQDVTVPLEASGVLRRLGQGASPLQSTLRRGYSRLDPQPKAYWPCEDGTDATRIASGLTGHPAMTIQAGANPLPSFATFDGFKCSGPLPTFNGTQWTGIVPSYTVPSPAVIQVFWLMRVPTGSLDEEGIMAVYTTGTAQRWSILYDSAGSGNLRIIATDTGGTEVLNSSIAFNVNNKLIRVDLELTQNGANVDWALETLEVGAAAIGGTGGTVNSVTIGRCTAVVANAGADHTNIAVGHISVHDNIRDLFGLKNELKAHDGETAGRRVQRLCSEESVTFRGVGDLDAASAMGPQLQGTLVDLLRECAAADGGILYEPRDLFGLAYRPRESLYNQTARLALDYTGSHLADLDPTDDDQHLRNDITVQRTGGASARAVKETGALSVLPPPSGVGRYDEQVTLNLQGDAQLEDMAGWRLFLGTVDEARYPVVGVDLAHRVFTGSQAMTLAVQDLDIGDRLTIAHLPAWLPPGDISQLAQGFVERMGAVTHTIGINCSPETPFGQAGVYEVVSGTDTRYTSNGSTLAAGLTTTATSMSVATPSGPLWSAADGAFDIVVGGERMTATAISGATSPQTFTVTRSVNGVTKAHLTGAAMELFRPAVYVP